jgi:hypothetical protein
MLIQGSLMHVNDSVTADQFLRFLACEAPAAHYYVAQPPPGIIMTAAIDWRVIVHDNAAADALALALWSGYEAMIKPLPNTDTQCPVIFVQIKNVRGECDQLTMGKDVNKKDGFMHRMKESVAILSPKNKDAALLKEIERTHGSDYWAPIV